jgi:hypothetical protein
MKKRIIKSIIAFVSVIVMIISVGAIEASDGYSISCFLAFSILLGLVASEGATE